MDKLLTPAQAAKKLGVTVTRLRQLRSAGRLKGQQFGPLHLFEPSEIEDFSKIPRKPGRPKSRCA